MLLKPEQKHTPFFYGWWVLAACAAIQFYFTFTFVTGFTVLFNPIVEEFGWSYKEVSLATTFRGFEIGFMAPFVGFFVDKFKPRRTLILGSLFGAAGFFYLGCVHTILAFYISFIILGLSLSMTSQVVIMTSVAGWFTKKTSMAMGIATTGTALAGTLIPLLVILVDNTGWRTTVNYFAIGSILICIPLAFIIRDPVKEIAVDASGKQKKEKRYSFREIVRNRNFWLLSVAVTFAGCSSVAVTAHQIPSMTAAGLDRQVAGWMVVIFSISGASGRLFFGWLGDKLDRKICFIIAVITQGIGLFGFALSTTPTPFFFTMIFLGFGIGGTMPLRAGLQLSFFGIRQFAIMQGLLTVVVTVGAMISPPFAGWVYDTFNTYRQAWLILAAVSFLAIPTILLASKPPENINT